MGKMEQMTDKQTSRSTHDRDNETRAEFMAKIARVYDVPMTLIRYKQLEYTTVGSTVVTAE